MEAYAAGHAARAHPALGGRQIRLDRLPPKIGRNLEPCSIAASCRAATPLASLARETPARRVVSGLIEHGVLVSESSRAPLRLAVSGGARITLDAGFVS